MENTPKFSMENLWNANGWLGELSADRGLELEDFSRGRRNWKYPKEKSSSSQGLNSEGGGRIRIEIFVEFLQPLNPRMWERGLWKNVLSHFLEDEPHMAAPPDLPC